MRPPPSALLLPIWTAGVVTVGCGADAPVLGPEADAFPRVTIVPCADPLDAIGATCRLTAVVWDSAGRVISDPPLRWTSDDAAVVRVDSTGLLTAVANGRTLIRVANGDLSAALAMEVRQRAVGLIKVAGDAQVGAPGTVLPEALVSQALDRLGHPVGGTTVFYRVTRGGGMLSSTTATTDGVGEARVRWTLGTETGNQTVEASLQPQAITPAQYTAVAR